MWGNILTEASFIRQSNMSFLDYFLHLKGFDGINYSISYIDTNWYRYKHNIDKNVLYESINHLNMFKETIWHPLSSWHLRFTLYDQTQGFGILTNLTSNPNKYFNTYCSYNNCFVDNPMIIFEEDKILDFLRYKGRLKTNSTFNQSIENYHYGLYRRMLTPNRNYLYLESCNDIQYKHKLLHTRR